MQRVDLVIVNPGARAQMYGELGRWLSGIEPPLWCALTAAFVRERGYSVQIIDAEAENWSPEETAQKIAECNPILADIIVLGSNPSASSTPKMTAAGATLTALKRRAPHIKTMLSGLHPSAIPEMTLQEEGVDFVTTLQTLGTLKNGSELDKTPGLWYRRNGVTASNLPAPLVEPDDLPLAAWDLLPMDKYRAHNWHCFADMDKRQPYGIIYTSLGCPFNCNYCNIHALYNDKPGIRFRSPEKVVEEIDLLVKNHKIKSLKIIDELFALKEDRVVQICDLLAQRGSNLNIWCYARVDTVTERMLGKMKKAGINWVCYGFESASEKVRQCVSKKIEEDITRKAIEMTQAAGINILANFIFGLPEDNLETMQQTLDMAKAFNFEYVNFYTAMAYPGSALYNDAIKQGVRLPDKWYGYGQYSEETLPLPTKYLSAAEVLRFRDRAFREYLSNPRYLEMVERRFGPEIVAHIQDMLKYKIRRKFA